MYSDDGERPFATIYSDAHLKFVKHGQFSTRVKRVTNLTHRSGVCTKCKNAEDARGLQAGGKKEISFGLKANSY